jgi:hypothetical protein
MNASLDLTHKIVLDALFTTYYHGTSCEDVRFYYAPYNKTDLRFAMDCFVANWAEEAYDTRAFAIMATPSIRDKLNYDLLCKVWEEMSWDMFVWEMFLNDGDDEKYWDYYDKVESRVKCDWGRE